MIEFDNRTRQFSSKHNVSYKAAAGIGGVGYAGTMYALKKKYIAQLIDQGEDPKKAKKKAEAKYGSNIGNTIKGAIMGSGVNLTTRTVYNVGKPISDSVSHSIKVRRRANNIKAIKEANNPAPQTPKGPNALQKAGHGMGNFLNSFEPLRNFGNRFKDPQNRK